MLNIIEKGSSPGSRLDLLQRLPPVPGRTLPQGVALDVLQAVAQNTREDLAPPAYLNWRTQSQYVPQSLAEMLNPTIGNFVQRHIKQVIIPTDPETSVRRLEAWKVHLAPQLAVFTFDLIVRKALNIKDPIPTNYTLGDHRLKSVLNMATNWTTLNEGVHWTLGGLSAMVAVIDLANYHMDPWTAANIGAFLINSYAALGQRYTRAKLALVIEKALQRHREFDFQGYKNLLGIKLPDEKFR
jgi:hypothetical protein